MYTNDLPELPEFPRPPDQTRRLQGNYQKPDGLVAVSLRSLR